MSSTIFTCWLITVIYLNVLSLDPVVKIKFNIHISIVAQDELTRKMASLPIRTDTLRMRKVKEELEGKMAEVEEAIRIFSRPKVFVKLDS